MLILKYSCQNYINYIKHLGVACVLKHQFFKIKRSCLLTWGGCEQLKWNNINASALTMCTIMLFKIPLKFHHEKFSYHKNSLLVHDNLLKKRHTHTHILTPTIWNNQRIWTLKNILYLNSVLGYENAKLSQKYLHKNNHQNAIEQFH